MKRSVSFAFVAAITLAVALPVATRLEYGAGPDTGPSDVPTMGNGSAVASAFAQWAAQYERAGGDRRFQVALGWSKALSSEHTSARGLARVDLVGGQVDVEASGLPIDVADVWLVDNLPFPGDSVRPEPHDRYRYVGRVVSRDGEAGLTASLGAAAFQRFDVDLVVIARNDVSPAAGGGVLFGSPTLFQRLYRRQQLGPADGPALFAPPGDETADLGRPLFEMLRLPVARANHDDPALVAQGRELFFNQTFGGNGRTCGTCHPAANNLTIDPLFIAGLPPTDPLFVAEFVPALRTGFENPRLMRQAGLIFENLDGFNRPGVMRSVPHAFAMPLTIGPATVDGSTVPPFQRTGWSGDGAPGGGTLRDFSTGAVTQHFTRTLRRRAGLDFRLPTDLELDAMEAFMLSLGRQAELNLTVLRFRSEVAELGRQIFNNDVGTTVAQGKCFRCHENGGANLPAGGGNANFDTGVANLPALPADLIDRAGNPRDAGFGSQPNPVGGFGNGTFNTPPVVEAADTPPFFHNNAVPTLEAAVDFYTSDAFARSPSGQFLGPIRLSATEVSAVAGFLRVVNALENMRQAVEQENGALTALVMPRARVHIRQALNETRDAAEMLRVAGLHPLAILKLRDALEFLRLATDEADKTARDQLVNQAKAQQAEARIELLR